VVYLQGRDSGEGDSFLTRRMCVLCAVVRQVNFVATQNGRSSIPFWLAMIVCVLVSTIGIDASLLTGLTRENLLRVSSYLRERGGRCSASTSKETNEHTPLIATSSSDTEAA
jgi:hypothetical protein